MCRRGWICRRYCLCSNVPVSGTEHLAAVGGVRSGEALDEAGLAGAVVADDGEYFAGIELEIGSIQGDDATECLDEPTALKDGLNASQGGGHDFTFLIHWSMATARMTRMPTASTRYA